jgi:hypothetical protein
MKRPFIIACVVMVALFVLGTANATYFDMTECYAGLQDVTSGSGDDFTG